MRGRGEVERVLAEYEAHGAGGLNVFADSSRVPGGAAVYCGSDSDPDHWNVSLVRDDRSVVPLAAGKRDDVLRAYNQLDKTTEVWDERKFPIPKVIVAGTAYHFAHVAGRVLLGLVKSGSRAVLLAALGTEIAVLHVAGSSWCVLHVGPPNSLRELNVDRALDFQALPPAKKRADPLAPIRLKATIKREYRRLVDGVAVDLELGPKISRILAICFEDLADRAEALRAVAGRRLRGKYWVRYVLHHLAELAKRGVGDLVGRVGEIILKIRKHCRDFTITAEAMSDVLARLVATGTCIMHPHDDDERIWQINLTGLDDPHSPIHRALLRETRARHPEIDADGVARDEPRGETRSSKEVTEPAKPAPVGAEDARPPEAAAVPPDPAAQAATLTGEPRSATPPTGEPGPTPAGADDDRLLEPDVAAASRGEPSPAVLPTDPPTSEGIGNGERIDPVPDATPTFVDTIDAALAVLAEMPPEAAQRLRLVGRTCSGLRRQQQLAAGSILDAELPGTGVSHESDCIDDTTTTQRHARGPRALPEAAGLEGTVLLDRASRKIPASPWRRGRLHLSPDHTLVSPRIAIVAAVQPDAGPPSSRRTSRRRGKAAERLRRDVSPGTLGPRGPPPRVT